MSKVPETEPLMESGKLTKSCIGMKVVAYMNTDDEIKHPKAYGRIVSYDSENVLCDFGNRKTKVPYEFLDFDYCQDGWTFEEFDPYKDWKADQSSVNSKRIDAMFSKQSGDTPKKRRGRPPKKKV